MCESTEPQCAQLAHQGWARRKAIRAFPAVWLGLLFCCLASCVLFSFLNVQPVHAADELQDSLAQDSINVALTVGTEVGRCSTEDVIAIPPGQTTVYFCITIDNQSQQQLTQYTINFPRLNITDAQITQTLPSNEKLSITSGILQVAGVPVDLETSVAEDTVYTVTVTASDGSVNFQDVATARVVVGQVGITVDQGVGTNAATCATEDGIAVTSGTTVYYCITITRTGTLTVAQYEIEAPAVGATFSVTGTASAEPIQLTALDVRTNYPPNLLEKVVTEPFTNVVTVTARTPDGVVLTDSAVTQAVVGTVAATPKYTVGTNPGACAPTNTVSIVSNTPVYYCIQLTNTGTLPLERHEITAQLNNTQVLFESVYTQTLGVGETLVLTQAFDSRLARSVTANETSQLTIVSYTANGVPVSTQASATVSVGSMSFNFNKYAQVNGSSCTVSSSLTVTTQQDFYYCVIIRNTGQVSLTNFTISEPAPTNINVSFDYTLGIGQVITLTNASAPSFGLGSFLGPFRTPGSNSPTMTIVGRTAAGASTPVTQFFQIIANTPTFTPVPVATSTYTPIPTNTPTPTTTPTVPPTPTPTQVVVSNLPTATDPFEIGSLENPTPTAVQGSGNAFESPPEQPNSPLETPTPFVDVAATDIAVTSIAATNEAINAAAATEAAATAVALAAEAATATTQALDSAATQTALALIPTETPIPLPTDTATPTETPIPQAAAIPLDSATGGGATGGSPFDDETAANSLVMLLMTSFATSTVTLGWIWFLVGSVIFFAVAGMFAGLSFRQQEAERYQVAGDGEEQRVVDELFDPWSNPALDEEWPTALATDPDYFAQPTTDPDLDLTLNPTGNSNADPSADPSADPNDDDFWPASLR
ncbi:MAG: hypothetical protein KDE19_12935 [Caldilineaceae bacterium]|nr:hypothetical protein [Caldilineaceae bacterium]